MALNTVDNRDHFAADIRHGRWEAVLPVVSRMKLPPSLLIDLYEQVGVRYNTLCWAKGEPQSEAELMYE